MERRNMEHFKSKLLRERRNVLGLIKQMEHNEQLITDVEFSTELSELSIYDNHPSDIATELFDQQRGLALKEHEMTILKKIEDALANIEEGTYGTCSLCGREISKERLEFIPYTDYCVTCQQEMNSLIPREKNNRALEEEALGQPFGYGVNDVDELDHEIGFDAEDSYQAVQRFDWRDGEVDYDFLDEGEDVGYVEPIERVSNQQYLGQLPD